MGRGQRSTRRGRWAWVALGGVLAAALPAAGQTFFYSQGNTNINQLASWNSARDGSGSAPANFTAANQVFVVQPTSLMTASAALTISGTGSRMQIEDGGQVTSGSFNHALTLDMDSGGRWIHSNTTYSSLVFGTLNSASTFQMNNSSGFSATRTYPTLVFNAAAAINPGATSMNVTGDLQINAVATFRGTNTNTPTHSIGGDMIVAGLWTMSNGTGAPTYNISGGISNTGTISAPAANGTSTVNLNGANTATLDWGTSTVDDAIVNIASPKTINLASDWNTGATVNTLTVNGTLSTATSVISGADNFTLSSGATLITANATGLDGAITVTGTKSFSTSANYEFRGAATGATLPATVNNLTLNRSAGAVTLDGSGTTVTVNGVLSAPAGGLAPGATRNTLDLTGTASTVLTLRNATLSTAVNLSGSSGGGVTFDAASNGTGLISGNLNINTSATPGLSRTFTVGNGTADTDLEVSGAISDTTATGLTKAGPGTMLLSGANTYGGVTQVNDGALLVNSSGSLSSGGGTVTVNSGGTVGGLGMINRSTALAGGTLDPGLSPGTGTGTLTLDADFSVTNPASAFNVQLAGATAGLYDKLAVTGTHAVSLDGNLSVAFLGSGWAAPDQYLYILDNAASVSLGGVFANYGNGDSVGTYDGYAWYIYYHADSMTNALSGGNDVVITNFVVPEPGTLGLLALGSAVVLRRRRAAAGPLCTAPRAA